MSTTLPEPIAIYFRSKDAAAFATASECFSNDATVVDKGEDARYEGRDAIRRWMAGTVADYALTTDVTSVVADGEETVVTALVSGDFPGSPAEFEYRFSLDDGLIRRMAIEFVGFR